MLYDVDGRVKSFEEYRKCKRENECLPAHQFYRAFAVCFPEKVGEIVGSIESDCIGHLRHRRVMAVFEQLPGPVHFQLKDQFVGCDSQQLFDAPMELPFTDSQCIGYISYDKTGAVQFFQNTGFYLLKPFLLVFRQVLGDRINRAYIVSIGVRKLIIRLK